MSDTQLNRGPGSGPRFFYGWWIVGLAFLANFMSVGTGFYAFNVIVKPVCDRYDWSRTDANLALIIASIAGAGGSIIYGTILMRVGPRILMVCGSLAAGASFILIGHAERLSTFYLFYVLLFLGNGAYGGIVANTAVNNWFVHKRGRALGLATAGTSLSGAVVPFLAQRIIENAGLNQAFTAIGLAITVMAPISLFVARNAPEHYGLLPDGQDQAAPPDPAKLGPAPLQPQPTRVWRPRHLLATPAFWKIGFAYGLIMIGVVGTMSQLVAHFTDINFSSRSATFITGATAFLGAAGKFFWAALCDRFESRKVVTVLFLMGATGLSLIFFPTSRLAITGFIILFGFGMGGVMSTFPVIIAELYGRASFAAVARFTGAFLLIEISGYYIAARSFDITNSYNSAYAIYIALDLLAVLLIFTLKKPQVKNGWETEGPI